MDPKEKKLNRKTQLTVALCAALVVAALFGYEKHPRTAKVLMTIHDVAPGDEVRREDLRVIELPETGTWDVAFRDWELDVVDHGVATRNLKADEILLRQDVKRAGEAPLPDGESIVWVDLRNLDCVPANIQPGGSVSFVVRPLGANSNVAAPVEVIGPFRVISVGQRQFADSDQGAGASENQLGIAVVYGAGDGSFSGMAARLVDAKIEPGEIVGVLYHPQRGGTET